MEPIAQGMRMRSGFVGLLVTTRKNPEKQGMDSEHPFSPFCEWSES